MATRIQLRRDSPTAWTAANPVLLVGEFGVETGSSPLKFKIGDGATAWNALPYFVSGGGGGGGGPASTDALPEGATNLYYTAPRVRAALLTGLDTSDPSDVVAADTVLAGFGKFQAKWAAFAASVRGVVLTGLSLASSAAATGTDTVLSALGKLQAQVNVRPVINAPVSLGAATSLDAATHCNRQIIFSGASANLTIQSDAAGGYAADDEITIVTADASAGNPTLVFPDASTLVGGPGVTIGAVRKASGVWQPIIIPRGVFASGKRGLVPAAGGTPSASKYLDETGVFSVPAGGGGSGAKFSPDVPTFLFQPSVGDTNYKTLGLAISNFDSSTLANANFDGLTLYKSFQKMSVVGAAAAISRLAGLYCAFSSPLNSPSTTVSGLGGWRARVTGAINDANASGQFGIGFVDVVPAWTSAVEPSAMLNVIMLAGDSTDAQLSVMVNDGSGACTKIALNGGTGFPNNTNAADLYSFEATFNATAALRNIDWTAKNLTTGLTVTGNITTNLPVENKMMHPFVCRGSANVATTPNCHVGSWAAGAFA